MSVIGLDYKALICNILFLLAMPVYACETSNLDYLKSSFFRQGCAS